MRREASPEEVQAEMLDYANATASSSPVIADAEGEARMTAVYCALFAARAAEAYARTGTPALWAAATAATAKKCKQLRKRLNQSERQTRRSTADRSGNLFKP